jgi:hypothetical protein
MLKFSNHYSREGILVLTREGVLLLCIFLETWNSTTVIGRLALAILNNIMPAVE